MSFTYEKIGDHFSMVWKTKKYITNILCPRCGKNPLECVVDVEGLHYWCHNQNSMANGKECGLVFKSIGHREILDILLEKGLEVAAPFGEHKPADEVITASIRADLVKKASFSF